MKKLRFNCSRIANWLAMALVSLLVVAVILELGARILASRGDIERISWLHEDFTPQPRPYTMFGPTSGRYRGRPCLPTNKANGEFRVVVLGGSTVVMGDPPLPEALEKRLQEDGLKQAAVCSFGVVSQNSSQEFIRFITEVSEVHPDLVIFYDGGNDLMNPYFWDPRPGYPFNFLAYEKNPILNSKLESYPWLGLIGMGSAAVRLLAPGYLMRTFYSLDELRRRADYGSPEWRDKIAEIYLGNLRRAQRYALSFRFLAFFQPTLYFKEHLSPAEIGIPTPPSATGEGARTHARLVRERIRDKLALESPEFRNAFVDASDLFRDNPKRIFRDYIHFADDQLNGEVAARIADELKHRHLLPKLIRAHGQAGY